MTLPLYPLPEISPDDFRAGYQLIQPWIHRTPVLHSRLVNAQANAEVVFKCENFQKMGAFKMRGAMHALLRLTDADRARGVVTHSSGNFAQALSLAAHMLHIPAYIVMPNNAPLVKKVAVRDYGGQIVECPPTLADREAYAQQIVQEKQATFIHPFNDRHVIIGQGTAAMELLEDHPDLERVYVPVGGGGLISGCALAIHYFANPTTSCSTIGTEPQHADDAFRSLASGTIEPASTNTTIADGLRTTLGDLTFPILQKHVAEIITVSESEIISAMRFLWERLKIVIEPSAAVAYAGLLRDPLRLHKKVGVILSGGNVDLASLPFASQPLA